MRVEEGGLVGEAWVSRGPDLHRKIKDVPHRVRQNGILEIAPSELPQPVPRVDVAPARAAQSAQLGRWRRRSRQAVMLGKSVSATPRLSD